jgi:hypothetical protein
LVICRQASAKVTEPLRPVVSTKTFMIIPTVDDRAPMGRAARGILGSG